MSCSARLALEAARRASPVNSRYTLIARFGSTRVLSYDRDRSFVKRVHEVAPIVWIWVTMTRDLFDLRRQWLEVDHDRRGRAN